MGTRIAVLIPAHNEQDYIAVTIEGVQAQTRPADRIIVVPNNCDNDDDTAKIAGKYDGVEVMELHGITGRKAGALNAALDAVLPELAEDDLVVMVRPQDCLATTVPVSDVRGLFLQRERWARGYIQTLSQFGLTRWTAIPWAKQAGLVWSVLSRVVLLYLLWTVRGHLLAWWCLPVFIVLLADSVNTAHKAGWRATLLALAFPVEMIYAWLITAAIASGYWKQLTNTGKKDTWKMVRR